MPFATVHVPFTGAMFGTGCPFATFGTQTRRAGGHQPPGAHVASVAQMFAHAPVARLHERPV